MIRTAIPSVAILTVVAVTTACDALVHEAGEDRIYDQPAFIEEDGEFTDLSGFDEQDFTADAAQDGTQDEPTYLITADEWDAELEADTRAHEWAIDELSTESGARATVYHTYVTYPFFNCPSNSTMLKAARNRCLNNGWSGSRTLFITDCYGVINYPSLRRRKIAHRCYWN